MLEDSFDDQEKLNYMIKNLQDLVKQLPELCQDHFSRDMLLSLANVLMDNTVIEIVKELRELQHMTEKQLHQQRMQVVNRHNGERDTLMHSHQQEIQLAEYQGRHHVVKHLQKSYIERRDQMRQDHEKELLSIDKNVLETMDLKVTEQQSTMEQVGVPGFHVTTDPTELQLQMYIFVFISNLQRL